MIFQNFAKSIIQFCLKWLAKTYVYFAKPYVIVVAGTTRRHWIKEEIVHALRERSFLVRTNRKNFNAEIGLPLSILNLPVGERSILNWLKIIWQAIKINFGAFKRKNSRTEYLVLEMAIDTPWDMKYLLSIVKPSVVVMTTITMIYQENFEKLDNISLEYQALVKALPWNGILILNNDDIRIKKLADNFEGKKASYGFSDKSEFQAIDLTKTETGQDFRIVISKKEREVVPIRIKRFGKHHIYAALVKEIIKDNFKPQQKDFFDKIAQDLKDGN